MATGSGDVSRSEGEDIDEFSSSECESKIIFIREDTGALGSVKGVVGTLLDSKSGNSISNDCSGVMDSMTCTFSAVVNWW